MSEKVKNSLSAISGGGKAMSGGRAKGFTARLNKAVSELTELTKDNNGMLELEEVLKSRAGLQREVEAKDEQIDMLRKSLAEAQEERYQEAAKLLAEVKAAHDFKDHLFEEHEARHSSWSAEKKRYEQDLKDLARSKEDANNFRTMLQTRSNETQTLRRKLSERQLQHEQLQQAYKSLDNKYRIASLQLEETDAKLGHSNEREIWLKRTLGVVEVDPTSVYEQLDQLAKAMFTISREYFNQPIANPNTKGVLSRLNAFLPIPQVPSNSDAAKSLRCAVSMAVVARELAMHIFRDYYRPQNFRSDFDSVDRALNELHGVNPDDATILRCQLAKACAVAADLGQLPVQATARVCKILAPWLDFEPTSNSAFFRALTDLFANAMSIWQPLQQSKECYQATIHITEVHWRDWRHVDLGTDETADRLMSPIAALFPHINEASSKTAFFRGYALFSTQEMVVSAHEELGPSRSQHLEQPSLRRASRSVEKGAERNGEHTMLVKTNSTKHAK